MKRVLIAAAIVIVVGLVAYTVYSRTDAEIPATMETTAGGVSATIPATCGGGTCPGSACLDRTAAFRDDSENAETACKKDCAGNCDKLCKEKGHSTEEVAAIATVTSKSPCSGCPGKCGGKKKTGST